MAVVLAAPATTRWHTYRRLFDSAFVGDGRSPQTLVSATPLVFTGLAAAVAFRMQLFNIGGEGQLYLGAIAGAAARLLARRRAEARCSIAAMMRRRLLRAARRGR